MLPGQVNYDLLYEIERVTRVPLAKSFQVLL